MADDRCFVNFGDDEEEEEVYQDLKYDTEEIPQTKIGQDEFDLDSDYGNNKDRYKVFSEAESELIMTSPEMLSTIREVAEELLATSVHPYKIGQNFVISNCEVKAREKLKKLGLNEFQIIKLIEFEMDKQSQFNNKSKKESKNLVYEAVKKNRQQKKGSYNRKK